MNKVLICCLFFVTISWFLVSVSSEDFCVAFERNGFNITYGFQRLLRPGKEETMIYDSGLNYLFIDTQYWLIHYIDTVDENRRLFIFESRDSQTSVGFGTKYSMPFCAFQTIDQMECIPFLLSKDDQKWYYNKFDKIFTLDLNITGQSMPAQPVELEWQLSHMSAPILRTSDNNSNTVAEMNDMIVFYSQPQQRFKTFTIGYDSLIDSFTFEHKGVLTSEDRVFEEDVLNNLPKEPEIVAIFTQFNGKFETIPKPTIFGSQMNVTGLIIVFKEGTALKYCWTSATLLSDRCKSKNLKVLIDCTSGEPTSQSYPEISTSTSTSDSDTTTGVTEDITIESKTTDKSSSNTEESTRKSVDPTHDTEDIKTRGYCNGDNGSIVSFQTKLFQYLIQCFLLIVINII